MSSLPTYEQIVQLPALFDRTVPDEFIDENGHMNIGDYFRICSHALWKATITAGLGEEYIEKHEKSMFTVEQHMRYYGELRLGQHFTVHTRLLERSSRVLHGMSFVVDQENRTLACTQEATLVHVSTASRSSVDLPLAIGEALDLQIDAGDALGWDAPVCGAMGLRKR
ncbi:acyl-CoA thioester hydrolase [Aeromicrobium panaciterrae]|uniref:Acyl-CoA thioester hydrolase n=1 Tax=Aeromicrobium panaciterrae TaxID=363861 RepID=A0ABU1US85_9ACTN|nr:thioesterase family protein [Aeromicrobium panaciterrae]MDR7087995.1 acyl-CoA thioester hydrolase [Aeromicrobium panaciterrae]